MSYALVPSSTLEHSSVCLFWRTHAKYYPRIEQMMILHFRSLEEARTTMSDVLYMKPDLIWSYCMHN